MAIEISLKFVLALKAQIPRVDNQISGFPERMVAPIGEITNMLGRIEPGQTRLPPLIASRLRTDLTELTEAGAFDRNLPFMGDESLRSTLGDVRDAIIAAFEAGADTREFTTAARKNGTADPEWLVPAP